MTALALPAYASCPKPTTPLNTLRAWERDLAYVAAWKIASFCRPLAWPEDEKVALRFVLHHAQDLTEKPGTALNVADIGVGDFAANGLVWIRLLETKTTRKIRSRAYR